MRELRTDMFSIDFQPTDAICVTTNGVIRKDGRAVMGKGIALEATKRFAFIANDLGLYLRKYGNRPFNMGKRVDMLTNKYVNVITFPTKHDWHDRSDIELIRTSAMHLVNMADKFKFGTIYLPRPGCANGGLSWEQLVRPTIAPILDDRFVIVSL